jgi:hypothetical protein
MRQTYRNADAMAQGMKRLAERFSSTWKPIPQVLPTITNVRLALDVAACDNLPLAVVYAHDPEQRARLTQQLASLAWTDDFMGRFTYVVAASADELGKIAGVRAQPGILVVQPDAFGLNGKVIAQVEGRQPASDWAGALRQGLAQYQRTAKSFNNHVRAGHQQGVFWETVIPVTDPQEQNARERGRRGPGRP